VPFLGSALRPVTVRTVTRSSPAGGARVRVLNDSDLPAASELLHRRPVIDVFVASRVATAGLSEWRLGAQVWGHEVGGELLALCYAGANLWPVCAGPESVQAFATHARRLNRRCASIVGLASEVLPMWDLLRKTWGPARELRADQPLMVLDTPPLIEPDPLVRLVEPAELDILLPAAVAMFTEEIGVAPESVDLYRARVAELIAAKRCFARIDNGRVVFKAEVGAATTRACQVQGVWVDPGLRGQGLGAAGTAAVSVAAQRDIAPVVSLYVNGFNAPARRAYERIGFERIDTFASVLF
jgi:predicted GNAT family acetyltransferase